MQVTNKRIKSESILKQIKLADEYFNKREFDKSIDILNELIPKVDDSYSFDKCELYRKLGNNYYYKNDYDNSIPAYENTLRFYNNNASIYNMLGFMYFYKDSDKSIENYLKGMKLKPDLKNYVMLTQIMIKSKNYTQKDLKNIFEKYVDVFRPQILKGQKPYTYDRRNCDKNKRLKIGYLSSDFYCHAMMSFVLPILETHDKEKFDIVLYSCSKKSDTTTSRIQETGFEFIDCKDLSNEDLAKKIHDDGVDILVDLSGYTHNAIWSLLYKPAPIICQYLGFLGTYGMREVDYIICDEFTVPKDISKYYTEKPMYIKSGMNRFTFNSKKQNLPDLQPLPYDKNGYLTFGSFNCMSKINPYTVKLWSKVLKAVPTSKLLIYRTQLKDRDIERYKKQFLQLGIDLERIIFDNKPTAINHFNSYVKCDIALDPLPFSGLTITIEQAYMGVPVLALPGETFSAKGAARVNRALGLEDFVAIDEDDYVEKAVEASNNIDRLRYLRQNLRNIVSNSVLCNGYREYTQEIEQAYQQAWYDFCEGVK